MGKASSQVVVLALFVVASWACSRADEPRATIDAAASSADAGTGTGDAEAQDGSAEDEVRPVYPEGPRGAASPLAERLCKALVERQESRRAECCKAPSGIVMTDECVRMTSAALASGAVRVDTTALDTCSAAIEATFAGCDWVGPFAPALPAACRSLFTGTLTKGARCRSSLECAGTLRCQGVGPTTLGRCDTGKADGEPCGSAVDSLATVARQAVDDGHPECQKACVARKCGELSPDDAPCTTTSECRSGSVCVGRGKDAVGLGAKGSTARTCQKRPPSKLGEACTYGAACEGGAECMLGICANKKATGEPCTSDFECRAGCLKPAGQAKGTCGMRCDLR